MVPSPRQQRLLTSMVVTSVTPDGSEILARDQLGATHSIKGLNRPKGTGLPAVGETWLTDRSSGEWRLTSQFDTPPLSQVSDLSSLITALTGMGLVVSAASISGWTPLVLNAGWAATTSTQGYDAPAWIMSNNRVFLRGNVTGSGSLIAILPASIAPTKTKLFYVAMGVNNGGQVNVQPSGYVGQLGGSSGTLTVSLDQVNYLLSPT